MVIAMVFIECERLIVFFYHRRIYIQILAMRNKPNCVIRTFLFLNYSYVIRYFIMYAYLFNVSNLLCTI